MLIHWRLNRILFAPETEEGTAPEEEEVLETEEEVEGEETEGEQEEEAEGEEARDEPPPARKETRVQRLANEARATREENIRLKTIMEERQRAPQQPVDNSGAERARAERLALMSPEEKERFLDREEIARLRNAQSYQSIEMGDFRDEAKYDAIAAAGGTKGAMYAKNKAWVEQEMINQRKQGRNPSREALIRVKLGDDLLNAKPSKAKVAKDKEAAAARVESAKGKPLSSKGAAAASGKGDPNSLSALEARILAREEKGEHR